MHNALPVDAYCPAEQSPEHTEDERPGEAPYLPAEQLVHCNEAATENQPAEQRTHAAVVDAPVVEEYEPAGQSVQVAAPVTT